MYTYCNIGICLECDDGFYNANCTALCGLCANDQHCDKRTGACINGCKQNFKLPLCQGNFFMNTEVKHLNVYVIEYM